MPRLNLSESKSFNVLQDGEDGGLYYADRLENLRGRYASGVYAFFDARTRECLYIGESHSGRLFDTITRHFRAWKINFARDAQGRRYGGRTYNREKIRMDFIETDERDAADTQYAEIQRLQPRDNVIDGVTVVPPDDIPV